jgi:hypothetical protein
MGLFLVLFLCSAVAGGILRFNSRFGVFNSRLGRRQFPFSPATGIGRQGLDLARCLRRQNGRYRRKSAKFRYSGANGTKKIAGRVIATKGFDTADSMLRAAIRDQVGSIVKRLHRRGEIENIGSGRASKWKPADA